MSLISNLFRTFCYLCSDLLLGEGFNRDVAQLVARHVRDVEVGSSSLLIPTVSVCGNSSVGRASASQAEGREFEPRLPLC